MLLLTAFSATSQNTYTRRTDTLRCPKWADDKGIHTNVTIVRNRLYLYVNGERVETHKVDEYYDNKGNLWRREYEIAP